MKKKILCIFIIGLSLLLSACLYPEEEFSQTIPYEDQIELVQNAVNRYREDHDGLLPIKNKDADTDIYIKYLIDFTKLVPAYLSEIPRNAFENGGVYQYVIYNPELDPTVKVFDLNIAEQIREIQIRLVTTEYPPYEERISANAFTLDYSKLGYEEPPTIVSPFTGDNLPLLINGKGEIFVDYRGDLYKQLQDLNDISYANGEDIRYLLAENSFFVPAYSKPITIDENGEPIYIE